MASQRIRRDAAANAEQKIQRTFALWSSDDEEKEKENQKPLAAKMQRPNAQPAIKSPTISSTKSERTPNLEASAAHQAELMQMEQIRKEHLRRRAARMVHSSQPLRLSRRMSYIISTHSPQQSPIRGVKLSPHFQHSKIVKITRDTRKALAVIYIK